MKARVLFLGIVFQLALAACGDAAGTSPEETLPAAEATAPLVSAIPQVDIQQLIQRLCVDEGGDRGVRCSTFYFVDAAASGWQAYINWIIPTFYGLPAQEYIDLVSYVGDHFVPQTYGDKRTPVYAQQARDLEAEDVRVCYPMAESQSTIGLPAGCDAMAVLIPRAGARSVDGASVFPDYEYMSEIFGQMQSITTGIPEDAMRTALQSLYP